MRVKGSSELQAWHTAIDFRDACLLDLQPELLNFARAVSMIMTRMIVAGVVVAVVIAVGVSRFEEADPPGGNGPCDEQRCQLPAIMGVKLHFGEKVGQGNAQE